MSGDIYIRDTPENNEKIMKEGEEERHALDNILQKKLRELIEKNEQTSINKYSEGFCYACASKDQILSTLIWVCPKCRHKKGTEFVMAVQYKKPWEELCDICGTWNFNTWQLNVSMCLKDMRIVHKIHREYRKNGKRFGSPYMKKQKKDLGNDWMLFHFPKVRDINNELVNLRK